jgi:hypothetical protein
MAAGFSQCHIAASGNEFYGAISRGNVGVLQTNSLSFLRLRQASTIRFAAPCSLRRAFDVARVSVARSQMRIV